VLDDPEQLGADQATHNAGDAGIRPVLGQTGPPQLSLKQPEADNGTDGDEDTETGDLELSDAKKDRIDVPLQAL